MANVKQDLVNLGLQSELANYLGNILGGSDNDEWIFNTTTFTVHSNKADAADTAVLSLTGGGAVGNTRGAFLTLYGNESAGTGNADLAAGGSAGIISFYTNNNQRFTIAANGDLGQGSSGGDISLTAANTSVRVPVSTGITAAGTGASDATALTKQSNDVTTTASGTGVKLPSNGTGCFIFVNNSGANTLKVYPPTGHTIDGAASIDIATTKAACVLRMNSTVWVSLAGA